MILGITGWEVGSRDHTGFPEWVSLDGFRSVQPESMIIIR